MTFIAMVTPFCTCFAHIKASIKLSINAFILYHINIEFKITPTLFLAFRVPPFIISSLDILHLHIRLVHSA